MADESGGPPLPRRVPGATVEPGTPIRVERPEIPEDLRQRVLTAIADELRRDEAVARYRAQEQGKAEHPGVPEEAQPAQAGPPPVTDPQLAAALGDADLPALGSDPAASARTVWSPVPRPVDLPAPAADQADLDAPAEQQITPLPRRIPGTNGAPPPPAHVRRNFLPFSLLGRRLDPDGHTEPLPRITGFRADSPAVPDSGSRTEDPAAPTPPAGTSPFVPTPPGSAPPGPGEASAIPTAGVFPEPAPAGTGPWPPGVPGSFGPGPDAGPSEWGSGPGAPVAGPSPPIAPPGSVAPSAPAAPQGNGAVRAPVAPSAGGKQERSGRRYRIAGLLIAVIALVIAAVVVLLLSGGSGAAGKSQGGLGPPGAGARERNLAAAWVARQVSRTAVVACDAIMGNARAGPDQTSKYSSDSD